MLSAKCPAKQIRACTATGKPYLHALECRQGVCILLTFSMLFAGFVFFQPQHSAQATRDCCRPYTVRWTTPTSKQLKADTPYCSHSHLASATERPEHHTRACLARLTTYSPAHRPTYCNSSHPTAKQQQTANFCPTFESILCLGTPDQDCRHSQSLPASID
jgi:hypothetical protein